MKIEDTVFFKTLSEILNTRVNNNSKRKLKAFQLQLENILTEEEKSKVNLEEIFKKYRTEVTVNLRSSQVKKQRTKKGIDLNSRCIARTGLGKQCTRSKLKNKGFCKSHSQSLPYGRIDEPFIQKSKKKNRKNMTKGEIDFSYYIKTIIIDIDDSQYLIDENGVIYNHDQNNNIIGRKIENEVEWYETHTS